jgi:microcin C transport system substrate-binding protein
MRSGFLRLVTLVLTPLLLVSLAGAAPMPGPRPIAGGRVTTAHGLSMYGDLKYPRGFPHFDYVNRMAPKGGEVALAAFGTFDTLNPFILKGVPAVGLGETFETLTVQSLDEPFSEYGLIAETISVPADRSWVAFTLRPTARFHDGTPITVDDVIWSFETLKTKGHPRYRSYYAAVLRAEATGPRTVRFVFNRGENRELPLIVGQLPILSRQYWSTRDFTRTTLEAPVGSGPYRVESFEPGRSITYRRVKDYWGLKLPVNVGRFNADVIRYDYYRDGNVALEAFKAGAYDFRLENSAKNWATAYRVPAVGEGLLHKESLRNEIPTGMQAFVFNTRRPFFRDVRVRRAIGYAFDFEWANAHLFYGAYVRTKSYFSNSELASRGRPSPLELEVLTPLRGKIPEEVFTTEYQPPVTDGSGYPRANLMDALRLLQEAGWTVKNERLVRADTGEPFAFEILLSDSSFERIALPFAKNLQRLGIDARVRTVDTAQYQHRTDVFDFDMIVDLWGESLSPGNEQRDFWGSEAARTPGSRNSAGIADPAVDRLIDRLIAAPDRATLTARTRALDRVLLWGYYVIPHWHIQAFRVAYWDKFGRPSTNPKYGLAFDAWWVDDEKAAALRARRSPR